MRKELGVKTKLFLFVWGIEQGKRAVNIFFVLALFFITASAWIVEEKEDSCLSKISEFTINRCLFLLELIDSEYKGSKVIENGLIRYEKWA